MYFVALIVNLLKNKKPINFEELPSCVAKF